MTRARAVSFARLGVACVALALFVEIGIACGGAGAPSSTASATHSPTPTEVIEDPVVVAQRSVVMVVVSRRGMPIGSGSGVIAQDALHVITNFHVVTAGDSYDVVLAPPGKARVATSAVLVDGNSTLGDKTNLGNHVVIRHDSGAVTVYAHLLGRNRPNENGNWPEVQPPEDWWEEEWKGRLLGMRVAAGEVIGRVGYSGSVEPAGPGGAHLHWEYLPLGQPATERADPMQLLVRRTPSDV